MPCMVIPKKNNSCPIRNISIAIVPIASMRKEYADGYDYWVDKNGVLQIRIAEFDNPDFALYWVIHELMEAWRCLKKGITLETIEKFDAESHAKGEDDPGSLPNAPYKKEHEQSMLVQDILCMQDGYNPDDFWSAEPIGYDKDWMQKKD